MTARVDEVAAALRGMGYSAVQAEALAIDPRNAPRTMVEQRLAAAALGDQPAPLPSLYGLTSEEIRVIVEDRSYGAGRRAREAHGLSRGQIDYLRETYGARRA